MAFVPIPVYMAGKYIYMMHALWQEAAAWHSNIYDQ